MKVVPSALEKQYLQLDADIEKLQEKQKRLKVKLTVYHNKGYVFQLLTPVDGMRASIPWKDIAMQLAKRLFSPQKLKVWEASLLRRFPKQQIETYFKPHTMAKRKEASVA